MLNFIDNPQKDARFTKFNAKISAYHLAMQNGNTGDGLQLLQELYFFEQHLQNLALDSLFDDRLVAGDLKAILDWSGIQEELAQWTPDESTPLPGLATENLFNDLTKSRALPSDSIIYWREQIKPSLLDTLSFLWGGAQNQVLLESMTHLLALYDAPDKTPLGYFYALQQTKQRLLYDLNFAPLSGTEVRSYRRLLNQINGQISDTIDNTPLLTSRYAQHANFAVDIRRDFQNATAENKETILPILNAAIDYTKMPDASEFPDLSEEEFSDFKEVMRQHQAAVQSILPHLEDKYVHRLAGANNKTWLLEQDETAERVVLRIEQPLHATLIQSLRDTPLNEFFTQTYATYGAEYNPYLFVISEFAERGDLRSHRKKEDKFSTDEAILEQALSDIGQMAHFCQSILAQGAMHSDIKLSNFLLNGQNQLVVNDMKAFKPVSRDGKMQVQGTIVTAPFVPPEYYAAKMNNNAVELDAAKFMAYQLGLALYDHLVLPAANAEDELLWSEKPLDFNLPIFATALGQHLQKLITQLTHADPEHRASLEEVVQHVNLLQSQSVKLHMSLQVSAPSIKNRVPDAENGVCSAGVLTPANTLAAEISAPNQEEPQADRSLRIK